MARVSAFPPELSLLLACLRPASEPGAVARLCDEVVDWDGFVGWWVRYHRALPQVHQCLSRLGWPGVPQGARDRLEIQVDRHVAHSLGRASALVTLCRQLDQHGVRHLAFKGPTLALRLSGEVHLRHTGDLDLLVDPARIADAAALLCSDGYRRTSPDFELSPRQRRSYERQFHHLVHHKTGVAVVEIHWRMTRVSSLFPLSLERLFAGARVQAVAGYPVSTLSDEDMALYLCVHGAAHFWRRLCWVSDIDRFMREAGLDWDTLWARATDLGIPRVVHQGAWLAHHLLGCPIGDRLLGAARRDSATTRMSRMVVERLVDRHDAANPTARELLQNIARLSSLRRNLGHKLGVIRMKTLLVDDWRMLPLPDSLFPLYYLLRLPLWCARHLVPRGGPP